MIFENIKSIKISDSSTWKDKLFLTFDIDWCSDKVLSYTIDIIEKYNIKATFFVTHETSLLDRLKKNKNIELGIHPNFNFLLNGDFRYGKNFEEVLQYYLKFVPDAKSVRSHSMTQSSPILSSFSKYNLEYDCNHYIPNNSGIELKPWNFLDTRLIKVPYFWEDDFHCIYKDDWNLDLYINAKGIKVFDFHPIHVFLNTEHLDRYEKSREWHNCEVNLLKHRYEGYGTYNFLIDLIKEKNNDKRYF